MSAPQNASSLPKTAILLWTSNGLQVSSDLVQLLKIARENYAWPAGVSPAKSQNRIFTLENDTARRMNNLTKDSAHEIIIDVSEWAGNNTPSHTKIINAAPEILDKMFHALQFLANPKLLGKGIKSLCEIPGISLVIASKIYRFCVPQLGAAVDRHASYFFNSLPDQQGIMSTNFSREWSNGRHVSSRLAIYTDKGFSLNFDEYINIYLPLLNGIATWLNSNNHQYVSAHSRVPEDWKAADVEMAAYFWWAGHGLR